MIKKKTADFTDDILRLRNAGTTYEEVAKWLAVNKNYFVSPPSIRYLVKKLEVKNLMK